MSNLIVASVVVVLSIPKSVPALATRAQDVVAKMTNNPRFPNPTIALTVVTTQIQTLLAQQANVRAGTKGMSGDRDLALDALVYSLQRLRDYVAAIAAADPKNAVGIVDSAGMRLRKPRKTVKPDIKATCGAEPGTAKVRCKAIRGKTFYEWQWSTDGKAWIDAPTTSRSKTLITGLASVVRHYFRYRVGGTKDGFTDWSRPCQLVTQ